MPIRQDPITATVTTALMAAFTRTMSPNRWATYMRVAGHKSELALKLYLWNAAIGQSFHFPLQSAEVSLRNVCNAVLCARFGLDWCRDTACRAVLDQWRISDIDKTIRRLERKYGSPPHTDQIVASLTLGFWAAILNPRYHTPIWDTYEAIAFPNLATSETITDVSKAVDDIQNLRNRIFHQEPLIGRNLMVDYQMILKTLAWICRETHDWTRKHSSVPIVMRMRPR